MATDKNQKSKIPLKIPLIGQLAFKNFFITKKDLIEGVIQCSQSKNPTKALTKYFLSNKLISLRNVKRLAIASKTLQSRQKELKLDKKS